MILFFFFFRYEDEINKRTECENDFVLIKKVRIQMISISLHLKKTQQCYILQLVKSSLGIAVYSVILKDTH